MQTDLYKVDIEQLNLNKENVIAKMVSELETKALTPVVFIRQIAEFKKLRDRKTDIYIQEFLISIIIKASALSGIKNPITLFDQQDIMRMLFNLFGDLSAEEINKAFELERYGAYQKMCQVTKTTVRNKTEHYQLFNADYVGDILRKYREWKMIIKTQHNITAVKPLELPSMSESQEKEILIKSTIDLFEEFKSTRLLPEFNSHIFDFLFKIGVFKKIDDIKWFNWYQSKNDQAGAEIKKELEGSASELKKERNLFKEELIKIAEKQSAKVNIRAKHLCLIDFFKTHIERKTDMSNFLKQKHN